MSRPVLRVSGVGKAYATDPGLGGLLARWAGLRRAAPDAQWVLRGADFTVERGETVGIVGHNGAGKSTLLKLIAGTAFPTEGRVAVGGSVNAIIELGLGFHAELTGRENAVLAGGLMGMSRAEIRAELPGILRFSELDGAFDAPLRTYSSGMQARLAFSLATVRRPDLLLIDEVLSVGDIHFQHKSFERIQSYRDDGTALMFVSHDRAAVLTLCDRVMLIDDGRIIEDGDPETVMDYYNAIMAKKTAATVEVAPAGAGKGSVRSGSGEAELVEIELHAADGKPVDTVNVGDPVALVARVRVKQDLPRLVFGYLIRDRLGRSVFGTNTHFTEQALDGPKAGSELRFRVGFDANIGPGTYSVSTALTATELHTKENYEWRDRALVFSVANLDRTRFVGLSWIPPRIEIGKP